MKLPSNPALYESILSRYQDRLRRKDMTDKQDAEYQQELDEVWAKLTPEEKARYEKAGLTTGAIT